MEKQYHFSEPVPTYETLVPKGFSGHSVTNFTHSIGRRAYIDIKRFEETFEHGMQRLESSLEKWFFTDSAKELARQEITERRQEKDGDHLFGGPHV